MLSVVDIAKQPCAEKAAKGRHAVSENEYYEWILDNSLGMIEKEFHPMAKDKTAKNSPEAAVGANTNINANPFCPMTSSEVT